MPTKDLVVLAECVDARSGKRFFPGDTFDPTPTVDQATRLVTGKCLPRGALAVAAQAEADAEAAASKASTLDSATQALAAANQAVIDAQTALDAATDDKKEAATKALSDAQAVAKAADADLKKLSK